MNTQAKGSPKGPEITFIDRLILSRKDPSFEKTLTGLVATPSRDFDLLVFPEVREVEEEDGPGVVDEERREYPELDDMVSTVSGSFD